MTAPNSKHVDTSLWRNDNMTITKPPKLSEMPMMCISSSQMKYGTAFKQPSKSSIFDRPNDS